MTISKLAAVISTGAAIVVVVATFWQWWDITYDGGMRMHRWVRCMLVVVAAALAVGLVLLFVGD